MTRVHATASFPVKGFQKVQYFNPLTPFHKSLHEVDVGKFCQWNILTQPVTLFWQQVFDRGRKPVCSWYHSFYLKEILFDETDVWSVFTRNSCWNFEQDGDLPVNTPSNLLHFFCKFGCFQIRMKVLQCKSWSILTETHLTGRCLETKQTKDVSPIHTSRKHPSVSLVIWFLAHTIMHFYDTLMNRRSGPTPGVASTHRLSSVSWSNRESVRNERQKIPRKCHFMFSDRARLKAGACRSHAHVIVVFSGVTPPPHN